MRARPSRRRPTGQRAASLHREALSPPTGRPPPRTPQTPPPRPPPQTQTQTQTQAQTQAQTQTQTQTQPPPPQTRTRTRTRTRPSRWPPSKRSRHLTRRRPRRRLRRRLRRRPRQSRPRREVGLQRRVRARCKWLGSSSAQYTTRRVSPRVRSAACCGELGRLSRLVHNPLLKPDRIYRIRDT